MTTFSLFFCKVRANCPQAIASLSTQCLQLVQLLGAHEAKCDLKVSIEGNATLHGDVPVGTLHTVVELASYPFLTTHNSHRAVQSRHTHTCAHDYLHERPSMLYPR